MNACILFVEDNEDDQFLLKEAVRRAGLPEIAIVMVNNGKEMFDYLNSTSCSLSDVDLIVLDLNMPVLDGRTALVRLKASELYKKIPVIILTTSSSHVDVNDCYNHGTAGYVIKPSTMNELVVIIQSIKTYWYDTVIKPK